MCRPPSYGHEVVEHAAVDVGQLVGPAVAFGAEPAREGVERGVAEVLLQIDVAVEVGGVDLRHADAGFGQLPAEGHEGFVLGPASAPHAYGCLPAVGQAVVAPVGARLRQLRNLCAGAAEVAAIHVGE